jgi:hypothetical protein
MEGGPAKGVRGDPREGIITLLHHLPELRRLPDTCCHLPASSSLPWPPAASHSKPQRAVASRSSLELAAAARCLPRSKVEPLNLVDAVLDVGKAHIFIPCSIILVIHDLSISIICTCS